MSGIYLFIAKNATWDTIIFIDANLVGNMMGKEDYRLSKTDVYNSYNDKIATLWIDGMLIKKFEDKLLTYDQFVNSTLSGINIRSDISVAPNGELFVASGRSAFRQ